MIMVKGVIKSLELCPGTPSNVLEFLSPEEHEPCLTSLTSSHKLNEVEKISVKKNCLFSKI